MGDTFFQVNNLLLKVNVSPLVTKLLLGKCPRQ